MSKNIGTGEPTTRAGLFKIRHLGEGQYSIRSMLDNRMGLMYSSTDVYLGNVGTSADNVPENAKWIISTNDSGYYVRGANTGKSLALPNVVNDGVEVDWSTYHSNYLNYNWFITKSTQTIHGIDITQKTDTLVLGNTFQFGAVFYSTTGNINGQNLVWDIDESASIGSASISSTGVLTPISTGTVTVTIDYVRNGVKQWGDCWVIDIAPTHEQISDILNELYMYAENYAPSNTRMENMYLVVSYIRNLTTRYIGELWIITTGVPQFYSGYIDYVNLRNPEISAMLADPNLIISDNGGNKVDFHHMIATLNGIVYVEIYPDAVSDLGQNFAGWAGDLQSLVPDVMGDLSSTNTATTYENIYDRVRFYLSQEDGSHFTKLDLYADMDAYCIYQSMLGMNMEEVGDYFLYHYSSNYQMRFSIFVSGMTYGEILDNARYYMDLPLILGGGINLTNSQKQAFATAFADHIWEEVQNEGAR